MALEIFVDRTASVRTRRHQRVHLDDDTCDCDTGFDLKSLKKDGHFTTQVRTTLAHVLRVAKRVPAQGPNMERLPLQGQTNQRVQKTVEASQVQFIDKVVDVPVVMQRKVPTTQKGEDCRGFPRKIR